MGGTIFICYRREDAAGAGRLYDRLEHTFGPQRLFMDVDNIPPGEDFVAVLKTHVAACDVLLALIGRGWLTATDMTGHRRLDNPDDFVRIEIASGLAQGKRVIPVLVDDATMPRANELPEELMPLAHRQGVRIAHDRFKDDAERLARVLEKALAEAEVRREAEEERQRAEIQRKAEEERQRAEIQRKAEEKHRERTIADLQQQRRRAAEQIKEARRRAETEAHQAAKEQKRGAQPRREQDEAETARVPKAAYNNDARKIAIWLLAAIIIFAAGAALILSGRNWFTLMERNAPAWTEPTPPTTSVSPTSPEADKTREEPTQTQPGETVPPPERSAKQLRPPSAPTEPTRKKPGKQLPGSSPERDRASLLCGDILHRRQLGEVLSEEDLRYLKECQ